MTASHYPELYRVKFRIGTTAKAKTQDPLGVEAWVTRTPSAESFKQAPQSTISNSIGVLIDSTRKSSTAELDTASKAGNVKGNKGKTATKLDKKNENPSAHAVPVHASENTQLLHNIGVLEHAPESANIVAKDYAVSDHEVQNTSNRSNTSNSFLRLKPETRPDPYAKDIDSLQQVSGMEESMRGWKDWASNTNPGSDTDLKISSAWTLSQSVGRHSRGSPLAAKSIPLWLLPLGNDSSEDQEFQAILHVYEAPANAPCRLEVSTVPLDQYVRTGKKLQILRVDYYRSAAYILSGNDTLADPNAAAGLRESLATTLFSEISLQADDLAVITRVYFVTQISAARRIFQVNLSIAARLMEALRNEKPGDSLAEPSPIKSDIQNGTRTAEVTGVATLDEREAFAEVWRLASIEQRHKYHKRPSLLEQAEDRVARSAETLHHVVHSHTVVRTLRAMFRLLWLLGVVSVVLLVWAPYWELPAGDKPWRDPWTILPAVTTIWAVVAAGVFLFYALNFRTLKERAQEMLLEWRTIRFADLIASLGSANANVAATRVGVFWPGSASDNGASNNEGVELCVPWVPEALLTQFDDRLHIKERLTSLERVLKAHDGQTAEKMHQLEEDRATVRRTVTAGASGVFVGLATSEVGEMVLRYLHVTNGSDQNTLMYWLAEQRDAIAIPAAHHSGTAAVAGHSARQEYAHRFHHPELFAHSLLLTVTLVCSLLAAWIAIRKPAHEQTAGHSHH